MGRSARAGQAVFRPPELSGTLSVLTPRPRREELEIPHHHLTIFVATRQEDVPAGCVRYLSVDGSVPGHAVRWDHHVTGERINLEAMPDRFEASAYDGVGTTFADVDALASVVAVLFGGQAELPGEARAVLESASFWCDHLRAHPAHDAETNRLGRGLLDAIDAELEGDRRASGSEKFARLARDLAGRIAAGEPLPFLDAWPEQLGRAREVQRAGKLQFRGAVALVDLRDAPEIDPAAIYALHDCPVSVHVKNHEAGGPRYTVGVHPGVEAAPQDIRAALAALAQAEFAHGPPALSPEPQPGSENWGGRARVFGSPWNYGSRLSPDEVVEIVGRTCGMK